MENDIAIKFEFEPIVKLRCRSIDCNHNIINFGGGFFCNLKNVEIDDDGKCIDKTTVKNEK